MNPVKQLELWRLRGQLREIRFGWRRELEESLDRVEGSSQPRWLLDRVKLLQQASDRNLGGQIAEGGQVQLDLIDYSIRLDQILAVASDTVTEFENTLAGELSALKRVAEVMEDKASLISGANPDISVQPVVDKLGSLVRQHRRTFPYDGNLGTQHVDAPSSSGQ
jgi:hypothetical protein